MMVLQWSPPRSCWGWMAGLPAGCRVPDLRVGWGLVQLLLSAGSRWSRA